MNGQKETDMIGAKDALELLNKEPLAEREKVLLAALDPARIVGSLFEDFVAGTEGEPFSLADFEAWIKKRYPALQKVVGVMGNHNLKHLPDVFNRNTIVKDAGGGKYMLRDRKAKEGLK